MLRLFSAAMMAGAAALLLSGTPSAASDITIAAIATGRLYVVGTSERPHTAVVLDDRFRAESDDDGKFQYELIYHPASCIVAATIEGAIHEAVVSNCGQQVMPGTWLEPHAAVDAPALLERVMSAEPKASFALFQPAKPLEQPQNPVSVPPGAPRLPVFTAAAWATLFVQSERVSAGPTGVAAAAAPASLGTVPSVLATAATPLLPAAAQVGPAKPPEMSVQRQVRSIKVQPVSFRSSATARIRSAAD